MPYDGVLHDPKYNRLDRPRRRRAFAEHPHSPFDPAAQSSLDSHPSPPTVSPGQSHTARTIGNDRNLPSRTRKDQI